MSISFWSSLNKPFFILAPMEDVTDTVFRRIIIECGRPDIFFTEFTNVEGLASEEGDSIVSQRLLFTKEEKPIIAQLWGKQPEHYYQAAKRIQEMGFDGIDINMGCPEKSVVKHGCCAALIENRSLAAEIIHAAKQGAGNLPVSVKTRIGFHTIVTEDWISFLLSQQLPAITVHGRTAKEESKVPAHWDEIKKAVQLRNTIAPSTLIIGNGDVVSVSDGHTKIQETGVDGIMIGRGIFHNPFLFSGTSKEEISNQSMIDLAIKHITLFDAVWGNKKHFPIMKKYFKIYIQGFPGASDIREKLMQTNTPQEALHILKTIHA